MILSSNLHSKTLLEEPLALHGDITNRVSWGVVMEGDHMNDNIQATNNSRKIMVVADSTRESTSALQYALSHAIHENDELILLHVEPPNTWKFTFSTLLRIKPNYLPILTLVAGSNYNVTSINEGGNNLEGDNIDFLEEMKRTCKDAQPKIHVRVERVTQLDGKDKAATILAQTIALGVDILVTGQRRNTFSTTLILGYKAGVSTKGAKPIDTAEYLIENTKCTCVAVQKRGQNAGYLLNTKTHKNFWLLA